MLNDCDVKLNAENLERKHLHLGLVSVKNVLTIISTLDCMHGKVTRNRIIYIKKCATTTKMKQLTVDCRWSTFGEWSPCTATCGNGFQARVRSKEPRALFGGEDCEGEATEIKSCKLQECTTSTTTTTTSTSTTCLLYTSPSPRDLSTSRMPSSA